jgi:hypothetical protein
MELWVKKDNMGIGLEVRQSNRQVPVRGLWIDRLDAVAEPAALLGLGGLALILRRRK